MISMPSLLGSPSGVALAVSLSAARASVAATATGGVTPTPSPTPTPTPTPTPSAAFIAVVPLTGQSDMAGRGIYNAATDTNDAKVKQYPSDPGSSATYRTIRDSIYPLYHPEGADSGNIGPGQTLGKTLAAQLGPNCMYVLLVPCAFGNTGLVNGGRWMVGGDLHEAAVAQTQAALAAAQALYPASYVHHEAWIQGNNDGSTAQAAYEAALAARIADMRARVPTMSTATPFVMGSMLPIAIETQTGKQTVEAAQMNVAAAGINVFYVPGPYGSTLSSESPDFIHMGTSGCRAVGVNLANTALGQHSIAFGRATVSVTEGSGGGTTNMVFPVYRTNAVGTASAPITFTAGATAAADFAGGVFPMPGPATWTAGQNRTNITIGVFAGTDFETDESFSLGFGALSGYVVGTRPITTGVIGNDDVDNSGAVDADGYPAAGLIAAYSASKTNTLYQDAARTVPAVNDGDPILAIADPGGVHHSAFAGTAVVTTIGGRRGIGLNGTNTRFNTSSLVSTLGGTIPNYMATNAGFAIHIADFLTAEANVARAAWGSGASGSGTSRRTLSHDGGTCTLRYADRSSSGTLVQPTFGTTVRGAKTVTSFRKKADGTVRVLQDGVIIYDAVVDPQVQASVTAFVEGARLNAGTYDQFMSGTRFARRFYTEQSDADFLAAHNRMRVLEASA